MSGTRPSRSDVEDFLYREAALLDDWRLLEWADLFTEDGEYLVPATDMPEGEPRTSLYLIYDDRHRLTERAKRLMKKTAHAEYPHSRLRRILGNVMLGPRERGALQVTCNFAVFRNRLEKADVFSGHSIYDLVTDGGTLRIRRKRAILDADDLRAQGKLSIIL